MARMFYSDYVRHCLRFYVRHENPQFRTSADKHNWYACKDTLDTFSDKDRETLLVIYRNGDTMPDSIYQLAKEQGVSQNVLWKMVNELERKVAKKRGLL